MESQPKTPEHSTKPLGKIKFWRTTNILSLLLIVPHDQFCNMAVGMLWRGNWRPYSAEWHSCPEGWRRSGFFQSVKPASAEDTTSIWLALALPAKWWGRGKKVNKKREKERGSCLCNHFNCCVYTQQFLSSATKFLLLLRPCRLYHLIYS